MAEHTPTPWRNGESYNGDPEWIFGDGAAVADCGFFSNSETNRANVDLILKAVNNHDALKAALENARRDLLLFRSKSDTGSRRNKSIEAAAERIREALAQVKP